MASKSKQTSPKPEEAPSCAWGGKGGTMCDSCDSTIDFRVSRLGRSAVKSEPLALDAVGATMLFEPDSPLDVQPGKRVELHMWAEGTRVPARIFARIELRDDSEDGTAYRIKWENAPQVFSLLPKRCQGSLNRRQAVRVDVPDGRMKTWMAVGENWVEVRMLDMSRGGVCFETTLPPPEPIRGGTRVTIAVEFDAEHRFGPLLVTARCARPNGQMTLVGCEFEDAIFGFTTSVATSVDHFVMQVQRERLRSDQRRRGRKADIELETGTVHPVDD